MTTATAQDAQALWNEVAAERAGTPAEKPAAKPAPVPAAQPAAEDPAKAEEVKPDPIQVITDKLAEFETKISGRIRNVEGHIGHLNGSQKELKAALEASKTAPAHVDAPSAAEIKSAAANPAEWEELKKDFPEWTVATERLLEARLAGQANANGFDPKAFEESIKAEMKGQTEAVRKEIIDSALDAVFPGWEEEVKTPEFAKWIEAQPDHIKAYAASDKIRDAATMLKLFDESKKANPANQIVEQRKQTLAAATATPKGVRTTTTQKSWEDMTLAERWDCEKRQRAKRAG